MRHRNLIAVIVLLTALAPLSPWAADPVPGSACSATANSFEWSGGPENAGITYGMFCKSSLWSGIISFKSSGSVGLGTSAPAAKLDINGGVKVGYNSGTCTTSNTGEIRYNSTTTPAYTYCNGSAWSPFSCKTSYAPADSAYFVWLPASYNGNLGGLAGANSTCVSALTASTTWFGYTDANTTGRLNTTYVKAFLCDSTTCNNLQPSTKYYFGAVTDSTAGGSSFTTDASGLGPNDTFQWSFGGGFAATPVGSAVYTWTNRSINSTTQWGSTPSATTATTTCTDWSSNSSGQTGVSGGVSNLSNRWAGYTQACNATAHLICFVNP